MDLFWLQELWEIGKILLLKFSKVITKKRRREGGTEPYEYDIYLQDLLDLSKDSDMKHKKMNEKKRKLA